MAIVMDQGLKIIFIRNVNPARMLLIIN